MARSRSTYTASPSRNRSPTQSPTRHPPSEGSRYELDLDALGGPDSTGFDTTDLEKGPKMDVIRSDDIDGPEDFTLRMEYWMRAPLPFPVPKSKKETNVNVEEVSEEAKEETSEAQDVTAEGDKAISFEETASRTVRINGTEDEDDHHKAPSESSMENEEKVRSYLDALPDTDFGNARTSTPLKVQESNNLAIPTLSVHKAGSIRSLQPTVEDYTDTPRKITPQTVVHHAPDSTQDGSYAADDNAPTDKVAELLSDLEQQGLASKTRIAELETLLAHTHSELDTLRTENAGQKDRIRDLEKENEDWARSQEASTATTEGKRKQQEDDVRTQMQEFGEELRLQNLAKLQRQKEEFEGQLRTTQDAAAAVEGDLASKDDDIQRLQLELNQSKEAQGAVLRELETAKEEHDLKLEQERSDWNERIASLQSRADSLHQDLEKATAEAKAAREEAQKNATAHATVQTSSASHAYRMVDLETRAQSLQTQLDQSRTDVAAKDQEILRGIEEQERLDKRFNTAQSHISTLETTISSLRQQLAQAQTQISDARTEIQELEEEARKLKERLQKAGSESDTRVAEVERKLRRMETSKEDAESRIAEMESARSTLIEKHEDKLEELRTKAEDGIRKIGALLDQERTEKRKAIKDLNTAKSKLEHLKEEAATKVTVPESDTDEGDSEIEAKEAEIAKLRDLLRKQAAATKSAKAEATKLKSEVAKLRAEPEPEVEEGDSDMDRRGAEIAKLRDLVRKQAAAMKMAKAEAVSVRSQLEELRTEAENRQQDFEAINKAMDERLASLLSAVLKKRAKAVVDKRDEQWIETLEQIKEDRQFMGRVLMREWGKQECGPAAEDGLQHYRYKYVKRS